MGVKSTIDLNKQQAAQKYVDIKLKKMEDKLRAKAYKKMAKDIKAFEFTLERLNDEAHDGEGFENYSIYG